MKMKQRIVKLMIMMVFLLSLTGCGGESQTDVETEEIIQFMPKEFRKMTSAT
jgi:hypothetical protein